MTSEIELILNRTMSKVIDGYTKLNRDFAAGLLIGGMIAGKHIFSDALFLVCMGLKPIFLFYFRVHTTRENVLVKISVTFSHQLGVYIAGGECTYA